LDRIARMCSSGKENNMMKHWQLFPVLLLFVPFQMALAGSVLLEPFITANFTVSMPKSWTVAEDATHGLVIARQNPGRDDSAAVLFMVKTADVNVSENQLLDTIANELVKNLSVSRREAIPGGGHLMVADGNAGIVRVRLGVVALDTGGASLVSLLVAKPGDFDALGGLELVTNILQSLKAPNAVPPPAIPPSQTPGRPAPNASGRLDVPPLGRPLTFGDLAGEWSNDNSVITNYVNYRGDSAGYESVAIREKWVFDANGGVSDVFNGVVSGRSGTRQVNERKAGVVIFSRGTVMTLAWRGAVQPSFVIRGWREMPGFTVLLLNGPWSGNIPADVLADRSRGTNLNNYWVRKSRP